MKRTILIYVYGLAVAFVLTTSMLSLNSCNDVAPLAGINTVPELKTKKDSIARGEYLVSNLGCNDCHSTKSMTLKGPEVNMAKLLGGYPAERPVPKNIPVTKDWVLFTPDLTAAVGPWGMSFAANISSDATGIGNWSEKQFFTAMRKGKSKGLEGARDLLPPMPWRNFLSLADGDMRAMFVYLKNTRPVRNVVPQPISPENINK
jgi:hypothetical protein